ncbi:MAG: T9SS type A sorting domain-containing protein [Bacteroidetes bacterium]|nr:T9SS type A sorting domain-containing protein [Bacteroidota bacterium]
MKRLFLIFLILSVYKSDAKIVKFSVDMTGQSINSAGVHISGDFQISAGYAANWDSEATPMTKEGNTDIYSVVVNIPAFKKYEYKFVNGDQFYNVEFVPEKSRVGYDFIDNRWIYIDSLNNDTLNLPAIIFAGNAPAGKLLLRFKVNLKNQTTIDNKGIHVAGDFNNWQYNDLFMWSFDGLVYEKIIFLDTAEYEYRYLNGDLQSKTETVNGNCTNINGNRIVNITSDTVLETVCFEKCIDCIESEVLNIKLNGNINIYPNPANDFFTIDLNTINKQCNISIYDISGKRVFETKDYTEKTIKINTNKMKRGLYIVKISNNAEFNYSINLFLENK